ncbi:MAG TPA: monovalent cation/H+ antiporter subunit D family protein [Actinobacteria bacterium]|nr:monovalent cation/H+ antiporter subunit D family protein [Actinomycetota bacterium]
MNQNMVSVLPIVAVFLPGAIGVAILFAGENKKLREFLSILASVCSFLMVLAMYFILSKGEVIECNFADFGFNLFLCLRTDWLGLFFAMLTACLWLVSIPYALKYMEKKFFNSGARFFGFFTLSASFAVGVTLAGNMLTLFIFYGLLTFSTYPLVIHSETSTAIRAAKNYLIYLMAGESVLLFAVLATIGFGSSQSFARVGVMFGVEPRILLFVFMMYVVGFGVKAAVFPFSNWLPMVSVAPTPVTGLLHAVAVVNMGVYGIMRVILNVFSLKLVQSMGIGFLLIIISSITIIYGSLMALRQDDFKRRLAFSTVAYVSYPILGMALLNPSAFIGGLFLLVTHAFLKLALFFCAGAIDVQTGKNKISELSGVGQKLQVVGTLFTIGSLGLIGTPLTPGFVGKWYLWRAPLETNQPGIIGVLIIGSVLCALYLLYVVYTLFFKRLDDNLVFGDKLSYWISFPIGAGVFGGLVFGIFPKILLSIINPMVIYYFGG